MELIGEGKTAQVYYDGEKAVKVYVNMSFEAVSMEAKAQTIAYEAGLHVPKVYGVRKGDDGVRLEMQYIPGSNIVWPKMDKDDRRQAFKAFVELQKTIHSATAADLESYYDRLDWRLDKSSIHLDDSTICSLKDKLASLRDNCAFLCHGDLHPHNVLRDGEKLYVIDWLDAVKGNPVVDICRSYLLMRMFFAQMANVYLRMSCEHEGYGQDTILQWLPIMAACRLSEGPTDKQTAFLVSLVKT